MRLLTVRPIVLKGQQTFGRVQIAMEVKPLILVRIGQRLALGRRGRKVWAIALRLLGFLIPPVLVTIHTVFIA